MTTGTRTINGFKVRRNQWGHYFITLNGAEWLEPLNKICAIVGAERDEIKQAFK